MRREIKGYRMVIKFFSCSQNLAFARFARKILDECSLARARKMFAIARMLGFSLKFARFLKIL